LDPQPAASAPLHAAPCRLAQGNLPTQIHDGYPAHFRVVNFNAHAESSFFARLFQSFQSLCRGLTGEVTSSYDGPHEEYPSPRTAQNISGASGSGIESGSSPGPSSAMLMRSASSFSSKVTWTCFAGVALYCHAESHCARLARNHRNLAGGIVVKTQPHARVVRLSPPRVPRSKARTPASYCSGLSSNRQGRPSSRGSVPVRFQSQTCSLLFFAPDRRNICWP